MPLILGVAGSIASGKSYLCRYLVEQYGAAHADGDQIVHRMYDPGTPGFERIVKEFGQEVVGTDGSIDRKVLGGAIFGNPQRTAALKMAIGDIAAEVKQIIDRWRTDLPPQQLAILEVFSMIENGYAEWCDATWLVATDDSVALQRVMDRNGLTKSEAEIRLRSARSWRLRAPACDRIFFNGGTHSTFEAEIDSAARELLARHRAGTLPTPQWHRWRSYSKQPTDVSPSTAERESLDL